MAKIKKFQPKRMNKFKTSETKLSNKKTNKLIKRGKAKPKSNYKSAYDRSREKCDSIKNEEVASKKRQESEDEIDANDMMDMTDPDDLTDVSRGNRLLQSHVGEDLAESTDEEDVEMYEKQPRKGFLPERKVRHLLPLKGEKGIIPQSMEIQECSDDDVSAVADYEEATPPVEQAKQPTTLVELYARRQEKLMEAKQKIANACVSVVSDPEENIKKLKDVISFLDNREPGVFLSIQKMAALSLVEVFRDIIPAYRIRHHGESKQQKVKKETRKLNEYEDSLLRYYKRFLLSLEKMINFVKKKTQPATDGKSKARSNLASLALTCFSELLIHHPHFNFRNNIIKVMVDFLCHKKEAVALQCCTTLSRLFKEDKVGEVSLEAMKQMKQLMKSRSYNVQPQILFTFLSLNIKEANIEKEGKKKDLKKIRKRLVKMSRKERKRNKKLVELEKELLETEAEESKQKKSRFHTEILEILFFIYFHILKTTGTNKSILLTPVLEGLSKFAHLINVEFFDDLIALLYRLIESDSLNTHEILHCLKTVFTILSGQGSSLLIDPHGFYNHLYQVLLQLQTSVISEDFVSLLQCLDVMITQRRKQITLQRVLAFVKRICTVSLQSTPNGVLAFLCAVRSYLQNHKQSDVLLDTEHVGSGLYLPELEDPEHCNANATSLWEVHYLLRHYHPLVGKLANHILLGCPLQGQGQLHLQLMHKSPQELYDIYNDVNDFKPPLQPSALQKSHQHTKKLHDCVLSSDSVTSQAIKYIEE